MLDKTGFKRKRFEDLISEAEEKAKTAYGENVNTSERSFLGILLRLFAWFMAKLWSTAEDVYNSGYIPTATGSNLDRLGPNVGISRVLEQYAVGLIKITGSKGHLVPAGFLVRTESGISYETIEETTIDADGSATVKVEALEGGQSGNAAAGTITVIVNPNPNIIAVTNTMPLSGGREKMTDPEFRDLFSLSVAGGGAATPDAIRSAILRVSGVRAATVITNSRVTVDPEGRPGNSYQCYVLGGDEKEIAEAIFSVGAASIESYGDIVNQVMDLGGYPHEVKFSRAKEVVISLKISVKKNESYPADGDDQIRSALVRYIGGEYAGSYYNGLNMGSSVIFTRLISTIYSVPGIEDLTVLAGVGSSLKSENVSLARYQVAQTNASSIEVTSHV
ncbi:baseplate J/gp47 family protein [Paenibacillus pini]|uniref:Baseplate protein J-like barrel domain-containing protein n=1 Tax=Paenibacillus pini JCM 16418 TaxID=1236976 RepID=W7YWT0_9BACL|nr:baseplate J/gp47 family protein [Paenibacillus pini]GAF06829.1 hypothetical protein JCM16418_811 [Paenibacillus pini JCM 16418]